ncbi:amino acid adenylation domain-containing protein [Paracoccus aerodenitrificans]|uniref:amino acid adenylation domain-containing protein n=1 Tax=Paracoccus aerodenitrificans TaxID=3017781 RepID=UPI0022F0F0F8|nr:amino acid adenylation domain-containing protein [Paracoccus aerodenitrificans]WBU62867.1 amino acid adenylation domain-containing protein [Paracoccus aerodenitrificans]
MDSLPEMWFPLTEAQEGLWYAQVSHPDSPILNTGQYLELRGDLDLPAFRRAVERAIAETEALRLIFRDGKEGPEQSLDAPPVMEEADLTLHDHPEAEALARMQADSDQAVDLRQGPVAAFSLFRIGEDRWFWYQRVHHLAIDGYGFVLLTNQVAAYYSAFLGDAEPPAPLAPLSRVLDEDAAWRVDPRRDAQRVWWQERLADPPEITGPAPGRAVSGHRFIRHAQPMPHDLSRGLRELADEARVSWADALTALCGAWLRRWSGPDTVIGVPAMNRMGSRAARVPAMVMNVLPLRLDQPENGSVSEYLAAVGAALRDARRNGRYRSEYLRRDLRLIGGARRLYGPLVNVQPFDVAPKMTGLDVDLHILGAGAVDDLTLTFRGNAAPDLWFEIDANPDLYDLPGIRAHAARLLDFLRGAIASRDLMRVATAGEDDKSLAARVNNTARDLPNTTLAALIDAQMTATPQADAVVDGAGTLSYADLDRRSAALAAYLVKQGAKGRVVAVMLDRSTDLVVGLLACLRAGAAYLPLDPEHPRARIDDILEQADPVAILTDRDLPCAFHPGHWPQAGAAPEGPAPGDAAYVIFTSGSTGKPKGVVIEHRAIVNRLIWMREHYGITARDRILQKTPATFDVSVWEFFLPLISGATLVMAPPEAHRDPAAIAALIREHRITAVHFVPSMLSVFLQSPASEGLTIPRVFCSGEALPADLARRFHARIGGALHNLYGPTEAAVDVSFFQPDAGVSDPLPIGWPVWNTGLHVLDNLMRPVPPGLAGQLYLSGVQLARGYLGRPDLTAERFVMHDGTRLYATGDLAMRREDGAVIFLGRMDHQVKLRGLRIELGEIETALREQPGVEGAAVMLHDDRIVAWVAGSAATEGLEAALTARLPSYMLPSAWVRLDALPVTANGKLDRKALPAPAFTDTSDAPATADEARLAALFAEILGLKTSPGRGADFFALGGDSLSAVRLILRIEEEFGHDPGLGAVLENPVLADLARVLNTRGQGPDYGISPLIRLSEGAGNTLFVIHPAGGLSWNYRHLARELDPRRPVRGMQSPGLTMPLSPDSLLSVAEDYAARIAFSQPEGVIHLAGWSIGGIIAQEVAVSLAEKGRRTGIVALLDAYPADVWREEPDPDDAAALRALLAIAGFDPDAYQNLDSAGAVTEFLRQSGSALGSLPGPVLDGVVRVVSGNNRLLRAHHHRRYDGELIHLRAGRDHRDRPDLIADRWQAYARNIVPHELPFLHSELTGPEASRMIAPILSDAMSAAER